MNWFILFIAGVFEVTWAVALKYSAGFHKLAPSIITVVAMGLSVYFLAVAIKQLPLGTAYAVWTGIGALGTAILGIILFKEPATFARLFCIGLIFFGIIGLKLLSN